MAIYIVGNRFHVNTEDGALGYLISEHRTHSAAERALAKVNSDHDKQCCCGGASIYEGDQYHVAYGKLYRA